MKNFLQIIVVCIWSLALNAQTYTMNETNDGMTIVSCSGIVEGDGAGVWDYSPNSDYTMTFCSADGGPIRIKFDFLNIESGFDFIKVHDGNSTAAPLLANLTGFCPATNDCPTIFYTSSGTCLTLHFTSDGTVNYEDFLYYGGWSAWVSCEPDGCNGNPPAADNCATPTEICSLAGYCGTTDSWYTIDAQYTDVYVGNSEFCGSIENNSWLQFTAESSIATVDVDVANCFVGDGIQFVLFEGSCGALTQLGTNCWSPLIGANSLTFTGLVPGNSYYLMIDGFGGDICDYTVTAVAGIQTVSIQDAMGNTDEAEICPGECTTLSISSVDPPTTYNWYSVPAGVSGSGSTINVCPAGDMSVFCDVGGACGAVVTAEFVITSTPINFTALPANLTCDAAPLVLMADVEVTPCIYVVVTSNGQSSPSQSVVMLEDGVNVWGSSSDLSTVGGTVNTITFYQASPSTTHSIQLTGNITSDMTYSVYDCSNNNLLYSGTWNDCGVVSCTQTQVVSAPGVINGIADWSSTCGAGLYVTDWGAALFDPMDLTGPYPISCDITYDWDNEAGCTGTQTQTVIVGDNTPPTASNPAPIAVQCATDVPAPNIAVVTDEADNNGVPTVTFLNDTDNGGTCPKIITRTYRVTDNCGNYIDVVQTITAGGTVVVTIPANGSSTVTCPANATLPTPPSVSDACGRALSVSLAGSTADPACEGSKTYNFTYTDCLGATYPWSYVYTIDYSGALTAPANGSSTISCPAAAINPGAPANITDACGRSISAVLVGSTQTPNPVTCEGTIVWTYRYTACDGTTTADWTYTYTIDYSGGLTVPANGSSTVSCPVAAINPGAPANGADACGRSVTPVLVGSTQTPNPVTCEGTIVWTYRYTACDGTTTADWTYTYTIDYSGGLTPPANGSSTVSCPAAAINPGAPANITDACGRSVSAVLIGSTQTPNPVTCEGTVVWTYRYMACDGTTTADWTYTYTIDYSGGLTPPANGSSTVSCPAAAINPGAPANIADACGRSVSAVLVGSTQTPNPVTCEGTVVWTYRYTACDATTTADWTYTYTIDYSGGLTPPANGSSTVSCPAAAINPGAPANITDACGRSVSAVLIGSTQTPNPVTCEGTIVWTYRYTACDATTTADWTYTYTIDIPIFTIGFADGTATVSCPVDAVDPGSPGVVTDACGNTLTPVVTAPSTVGCSGGTMDWLYTYTDCAGNSDTWTFSYTVSMAPFTISYANGSSTVNCSADALVQPAAPGVVNDQCGNAIVPVITAPTAIACEGTMAWIFTYTDCAGTTLDWTYTYTIDVPSFAIGTANGASTVNCVAAAQVQPAAPVVTDACGNTLTPTVTSPTAIACEGTMAWIFTYTDCAGNTSDWTYTYTIDLPVFAIGTANGSSTVNCVAAAQVQPAAPVVTDACGNTLTPTVTSPTAIACEGTMAWIFTYIDCAGNTTDWTYTYTIDLPIYAIGTANGSSTVNCIAAAQVQPAAPVVTDACGNTLTPTVISPTAIACEGTMAWIFTYTDCAGNTADWTYTYTIDLPVFTVSFADGSATVSCPADAVDPGSPGVVTDACGNTLTPVVTAPSAVGCSGGSMDWLYTYTDCAGNSDVWTFSYTVSMTPFTLAYLDGSATVSCPADAVDPGSPGVVTDQCGNTITPVVTAPSAVGCSGGTMDWIYTYTDCAGNSDAWTFSYTVSMTPFTLAYLDGSATVSCPADAVDPGNPGVVTDQCGNTITPVVTAPSTVGCSGGTMDWIYTYTDCAGNSDAWIFSYTVSMTPFTISYANGSSTVNCSADALVQPAAPGVVNDQCGNAIIPVITAPTAIACEGTMAWIFTYTDCAGTTLDWTYTYTIDVPSFAIGTANGSSTVNCVTAAQVQPTAPVVTDACGNTLTPTITAPTAIACEGTMAWVFTYTDCAGNTADWTYTYTIDLPVFTVSFADGSATVSCPVDAVDPGNPGVVTDACGNTLTPVVTAPSTVGCSGGTMDWLYTYTDCAGNSDTWTFSYTVSMAPFTISYANGSSTVNCSADALVQPAAPGVVNDQCGNAITPVITAPTAIVCEGTMAWIFTYTDCAGSTSDWTYTYTIELPTLTIGTANGSSTVNCVAAAQVQPVAPVVTDACGNTLTPSITIPTAVTCEGTMAWIFTYTDCAGNTADWTYTYMIDVPTFTIGTVDGSSTVNCVAAAQVQPTAPVVTDACGNTLTPVVTSPTAIACEGTMAWIFTYTDCAGNTADWTYTYTIDLPVFTVSFADGSATISCPIDAVDPGSPGVVTDACGNTLTPVVTAPSTVGCSGGTMDWIYTYTDCAGNSDAWTFSYTVSMASFAIAYVDGSSTVNCVADALIQPTEPGVVNDQCGNAITPVITSPTAVACEGTMDWVFTYTDCAGNSDSWLYTYTVDYTTVLTAPANVSSTIQCATDATIPVVSSIQDACGNTLVPVLQNVVSTPDPFICNGTIDYIYRYTACDGTFADWTYTYTISDDIAPTGIAPADVVVGNTADIPAADVNSLTNVTDNCTVNPLVVWVGDASDGNKCPETIVRTYLISDDCGNTTTVSQTIVVDGNCDIVIPSAFTPNGDLNNDDWDIIYLDDVYPNNIVMVYNRWGNLIYESNKGSYASKKWNGTYKDEILPVGSYYYMILTEGDNSGEILKGTVSIIKK